MLGIQSLSNGYHQRTAPRGKSALAALLGVIPGLGAVFNRQNFKAVVHFASVVGLFQLTRLQVMPGLFALAGMATYIYTIIDAFRTAEAIANGESATVSEERFRQSLVRRAPMAGVLFIIAGLIVLIQLITPIAAATVVRLLPVALILFGGYLLTRYFKRSRDEYSSGQTDGPFSLLTNPFTNRSSGDSRRIPFTGRR